MSALISGSRAIAEIEVGKRHRVDLGDVTSLSASIREHGLLHPIVIRSDGVLIAGERRLAACKAIGWETIPTTTIDMEHLVFGEQAENIDRKDFNPEERVGIGEAVEVILGNRQGARTDLSDNSELSKNFDEVGKGRTKGIAAKKAGFKNVTTYDQAKTVRDAAALCSSHHRA